MRTKRGLALGLLLVVALTGCGKKAGNGVATAGATASSSAGQLSDRDKAVKYAQCLRDNGIQVSDPENGQPPAIEKGTASDEKVKAAMDACKQYQPTAQTRKLDTQQLSKLREVAKCMRQHGYPNFPDPDPDQGGIVINDNAGIDTRSSAFTAAAKACNMTGTPPSPGMSGGSGSGPSSNR
jgi:hypothetical protein